VVMEQIMDTSYAHVAYDRESDSIIAVWKEQCEHEMLRKMFANIEFNFSKYNAKNVISDVSSNPSCGEDALSELLKGLVRFGLKKLALIGINIDQLDRLYRISMISGCEVKHCDCIDNAQAWVLNHQELRER